MEVLGTLPSGYVVIKYIAHGTNKEITEAVHAKNLRNTEGAA